MAGNWQVFTEILNTGMLVAIISDCPLIATLSHFLSSIHRFLLRRRQLLVDNIAGLVLAINPKTIVSDFNIFEDIYM